MQTSCPKTELAFPRVVVRMDDQTNLPGDIFASTNSSGTRTKVSINALRADATPGPAPRCMAAVCDLQAISTRWLRLRYFIMDEDFDSGREIERGLEKGNDFQEKRRKRKKGGIFVKEVSSLKER